MVGLGLYRLRQVFREGVSLIAVAVVKRSCPTSATVFPSASTEFDKSLVVAAS